MDTTGDNGDSVMHFLFSHYAFDHPENFLDHWAKPIFVLLSSPFAYFGFKGMIVFNVLCISLTGLFSFYIAKTLQLKYPLLVFPLLLGAPLYFKLGFSGLTEYLFGLITVLAIYLIQKQRIQSAVLLISFLPLVRSEGLIVLGIFALFLLVEKRFRLLPLLLTGQALFTLLGGIYHQDLFWVVNDIPYANVDSPYGNGKPFDFVFRLMYVIEKPLMLLLGIGLIKLVYDLFKQKYDQKNNIKHLLIVGSFLAVFLAHALFWWLGIFNSMGLPRVLIAIVPLAVIIALIAMDRLVEKVPQPHVKKGILLGITLIVLSFPFVTGPNSVQYSQTMFEVKDHQFIKEDVAPFIVSEFPDYHERLVMFSQPYLSLALGINYFDLNKHQEMQFVKGTTLESGTLIIWDNWFSVSDGGVELNDLLTNPQLIVKGTFNKKTEEGEIKFVVLEAHKLTLEK